MDLFSMDKCGAIYTKHDLPGAVAQSGTSATSISNRPPSAGYFSSARFDQIANRLMAGMQRAVAKGNWTSQSSARNRFSNQSSVGIVPKEIALICDKKTKSKNSTLFTSTAARAVWRYLVCSKNTET
jgi:hypothetical protein